MNDKIQIIAQIVAKSNDITIEELLRKTRKRQIVQARQTAMYMCYKYTKYTLSTIGENLGRKDHATVLHAVKTINNLVDVDTKLRISIEKCEKDVGENLKKIEECEKESDAKLRTTIEKCEKEVENMLNLYRSIDDNESEKIKNLEILIFHTCI